MLALPYNCSALENKEIRILQGGTAPAGGASRVPAAGSAVDRLLRGGAKSLSPAELLALVLGPGGPVPAAVLAASLLGRHDSLWALGGLRTGVLLREPGCGPGRAGRLAAAFELGARAAAPRRVLGLVVTRPQDLLPVLEEEFRGCDREHFLAVLLDARHRVLAVETVSVGCLDASLVHPRELFRGAVALGAAAVIAAHNHPSGCARPSGDDIGLTGRLARCGRLLGIELLDHIVVGRGEFTSLREHGWPGPDWHAGTDPCPDSEG